MSLLAEEAIQAVLEGKYAFFKFISANEVGKTGSHQAGFYMPKKVAPLMFEKPVVRGMNADRNVTIAWYSADAEWETSSRFIYYGVGTRNEFRLTRFGKGFPFLMEDRVGDLLVLVQITGDFYKGFVLSSDEEIELFFDTLSLSPSHANELISRQFSPETELLLCFQKYVEKLQAEFPPTMELAIQARLCYESAYKIERSDVVKNPDVHLMNWIKIEYDLFKYLESQRYKPFLEKTFPSIDELITVANTILNRRKSRAGKSLEHHLAEIFNRFELPFEAQAKTEGGKRPDFLFPGRKAYLQGEPVVFLAAKTTCKDRWRQILNEADKITTKHLFTLQGGISKNQLKEMYKYGVQLVVPRQNIRLFPSEFRTKLMDLKTFVAKVTSEIS